MILAPFFCCSFVIFYSVSCTSTIRLHHSMSSECLELYWILLLFVRLTGDRYDDEYGGVNFYVYRVSIAISDINKIERKRKAKKREKFIMSWGKNAFTSVYPSHFDILYKKNDFCILFPIPCVYLYVYLPQWTRLDAIINFPFFVLNKAYLYLHILYIDIPKIILFGLRRGRISQEYRLSWF